MEQLADTLLNQNQHQQALELYQKCPQSKQIILKIANLNNHIGCFREAIKFYEQVFDMDNQDFEILIKVGKLYNQIGEYDQAIKIYQRVLILSKNHPVAMGETGFTYFCMEEHQKAIEIFLQCSKFTQIIPKFLCKLAQELFDEYKYNTALLFYFATLKLDELNSIALLGIVKTYSILEQYELSIKFCDKMINHKILLIDAQLQKIKNLIELNKLEDSKQLLKGINQNQFNYDQYILFNSLKAKILILNKQFDECIELSQSIVGEDPYAIEFFVIISKCQYKQNLLETALQTLEKVFDVFQNHLEALILQYEILSEKGLVLEAQKIKNKIDLQYF